MLARRLTFLLARKLASNSCQPQPVGFGAHAPHQLRPVFLTKRPPPLCPIYGSKLEAGVFM